MEVSELRAAIESSGLTQRAFSDAVGISKTQVSKCLAGERPISDEMAELVRAGVPAGVKVEVQASETPPLKYGAPPTPAVVSPLVRPQKPYRASPIAECIKRSPLYAETSAEAKAMREAIFERDNLPGLTHAPLIPLRPVMVTVGEVLANAAIPRIAGVRLTPAQERLYGWRGVVSKDGHVYDVETAHRMRRVALALEPRAPKPETVEPPPPQPAAPEPPYEYGGGAA